MRTMPSAVSLLLPALVVQLLWLSVVSTVASATTEIPDIRRAQGNNNNNNNNISEEIAVTASEKNPCSLCQGLTMLPDKAVSLTGFPPNTTCANADALVRQFPGVELDGFLYPENATKNTPGGCRSTMLFQNFFEQCCVASVPVYECEQNIHEYVLGDNAGYNAAVPPIMGFGPDQNVKVSMHLSFEAVEDVNAEEGTITIFVTVQFKWVDPRLRWDLSNYDTCANRIDVYTGHDVETAQIWLPNYDILNRIEGIQSFPSFKASIFADGTVHWWMGGGVTAFCAFRGLANIPFDVLGCQLLFGPGTRFDTKAVEYIVEVPEYNFYGEFDVTYNEYKVLPELGEHGYAFDGNSIYYNFFFKRATEHYVQNVVIPTVILTYLSFFTFFLDMRVGERLGFGMAIALVVIAQQIVTSEMTPISNHRLWLDKFVAWSFYWVLIGVIESVFVGFLFYIREDRQAKKENRDLAYMTRRDRESMMKRYNKPEEKASVSEIAPLSAIDEEEQMDMGELSEEEARRFLFVSNACEGFLYEFPLRRIDFLSLAFSIISYTTFLVVMVWTGRNKNGAWLRDEPKWFGEELGTGSYQQIAYLNGDPEN